MEFAFEPHQSAEHLNRGPRNPGRFLQPTFIEPHEIHTQTISSTAHGQALHPEQNARTRVPPTINYLHQFSRTGGGVSR
jgi:hypothetical protein